MPLSADQRAMLGLLLERGQSYADIAGLLGVPEDEVRGRARAALTELGGEDPDRSVGLTDYLLGQADPIGRADAVRHLRDDADDRRLADVIVGELSEIAPGAELPKLPGEPRTAPHMRAARRGRAKKERDEAATPRSSLSRGQNRVIAAAVAGGVILVVVILAVAGVFGGGGSSSTTASVPSGSTSTTSSTTAGTGTTTTATPGGNAQTLTPVTLKPVGGNPGKGLATFGLASANTPFLDVRTTGLTAAPKGQVYSLWLSLNPAKREAYPIAPLLQSHARFDIPSVVLPFLPKMKSVDVVVSPASVLRNEIRGVLQSKKPKLILREPGNLALRGQIPKKVRG